MNLKNIFLRDAWDIRINRLFSAFFIRNFTKTYYYREEGTWTNSSWLGVQTLKAPTDLWVYQEMIVKFRPDYIIETGTYKGGSAMYMASVCDMINHGKVITIDINSCDAQHPRVIKIVDKDGSIAPHVLQKVEELVGNGKCLVMLDSTHRKEHVLREMELYSRFVPVGWYLVVEDTCLGGNPVLPSWGNGPMDSVKEFVKRGSFVSDLTMHKFLLTLHPKGFLKRIR